MTLALPPQLESALAAQALRRGVAPEQLAVELLHRSVLPMAEPPAPIDEWERRLFSIATVRCGTAIPDRRSPEQVSGLYD